MREPPKNNCCKLQQMQSSRVNLKLSLLPWTWLTCHWTKSTADSKGEGSSCCLFHLCGHSQFWKGNRGDIRRNWLQNTNLKLISPRTKAVHKYSRILCFQWPKVKRVFLLPHGWEGSPSQNYLPPPLPINSVFAYTLAVTINTPGCRERHCENKVSCSRKEHNDPSN